MFGAIQAFDNAVLHAVQDSLFSTALFWEIVSVLGHPGFWFVIAAALYWNNREKSAFFLVNVIVLASAVTAVLKLVFVRPRPDLLEFKRFESFGFFNEIERGFDFSFPSGHATLVSALVSNYSKKYKKTLLLGLGIAAVLLVGISRLVLGFHFLSDVLAGIVLGIVLGKTIWSVQSRLREHHFQLTRLKAETGLVFILVVSIGIMLFFDSLAVAGIFLGFYAGFFAGQEKGFFQRPLAFRLRVLKSVLGLLGLGILVSAGLFWVTGLERFIVLFFAGFWVSLLFPWVFENALGHQ